MVDILSYIKSLVFPSEDLSRKRRAPAEENDFPLISKMRRTGPSPTSNNREDDYISPTTTSFIKPRNSLRNSIPNTFKQRTPIVIEDDDDVNEVTPKFDGFNPKSFYNTRSTSTPNGNNNNGDITFLKATQTTGQKKLDAKKQSFEYVKPFSYLDDNQKKNSLQNGSKFKDFSVPILKQVYEVRNKLGLNKRHLRSAVLDQSYRLDEKRKYQELLAQATTNSKIPDSFSKYRAPTGKFFPYGTTTRGKKMVELSNNKWKPSMLIDLTSNDNRGKNTLSTKDTIKKVLDHYENDALLIKDSDSDLEILPNPPSPRPDIKVPRINSFKPILDSTEHATEEWLRNVIQKHRKAVTKLEHEITAKTAQTEKLKEITTEIHSQRLEDQLAKYCHIKDVILPLTVDAAFPPLTDDDDARIDTALHRRANPNEILSSKFSLNITRRDIMTLSGLNWLNDEVINFYMNLIIERGKLSQWPNVYAMNTFFYPKLMKDGHNSLRRWTRRVDLFKFDVIAIPIHLGVHWCMSIIDFRSQTIRYYDSMGSSNKQCLSALLAYLQDEHLDKKQCVYDTSNWKLENVRDIPQQMNGSDCGMFACTFAEVLTRSAKIKFGQDDMPYLRRKMVLEILNGELMIQ